MIAFGKISVFITLLVILGAKAQDQPSSTPKQCNETDSMAFDPTKISGIWFEVARRPADGSLCNQVNLTLLANNVMDLRVTYSLTPAFAWVNQTDIANVSLGDANNPYGYNFTFQLGEIIKPLATYKVLDTDYSNYAFICGYQDVTNNGTYFNMILSRERQLNDTQMANFEKIASQNFTGFTNQSLSAVQQSCAYNGATSRGLPPMSVMLVLFMIFLSTFVEL